MTCIRARHSKRNTLFSLIIEPIDANLATKTAIERMSLILLLKNLYEYFVITFL